MKFSTENLIDENQQRTKSISIFDQNPDKSYFFDHCCLIPTWGLASGEGWQIITNYS